MARAQKFKTYRQVRAFIKKHKIRNPYHYAVVQARHKDLPSNLRRYEEYNYKELFGTRFLPFKEIVKLVRDFYGITKRQDYSFEQQFHLDWPSQPSWYSEYEFSTFFADPATFRYRCYYQCIDARCNGKLLDPDTGERICYGCFQSIEVENLSPSDLKKKAFRRRDIIGPNADNIIEFRRTA